jgi:L-fuconolactonase
VHTRYLPYLIEAIQPVPDLVVVIDHLAKPDYSNLDETWTRGLRELARRENTFVKISVMATEVSGSAHAYRFRDYVEFVLDTFGAARRMAGSDWPVSTPGTGTPDGAGRKRPGRRAQPGCGSRRPS